MKAIRYRRYGPPEVLDWVDVPAPTVRPGHVLVRVCAASLNPKDCLARKGKFRALTGGRFPRACGYDFAGTVISVGKVGRPFKEGDEVFGMLNGWAGGAHAEQVLVPADEVAPRPESIALSDAAGLPLAGQTALQALRDLGRVRPGAHILVNGASGGVGTLAVQIGRALGARVTAVCSGRNAELVSSLGATAVLDHATFDVTALPDTYDVVFDVFGNRSFAEVLPGLAPGGVYVTTVPRLASIGRHLLSIVRPGRKAWLVMVRSKAADLMWLAREVEDGRLRPVIDRRLPMSESAAGHRYLETKRARGKVLLVP